MNKITRLILPAIAALAACNAPAGESRAQEQLQEPSRRAPADVQSMKTSFAPVAKRAGPAVVNVYARRLVRQRDPFFEMFGGGVPQARVQQSLGSGVIVRADGVVVTNNHVVQGGQEFMVVLADRREFPAKVLLADPRTDLAVLKIDPGSERLPVLPIDDREELEVGDLVLAIGNPFGVGQTVTNGIISALNRTADPNGLDASAFIQTDASVNPGNSGGALVDMDGDLIGVPTFILSRSGTSSGVSFAIPAAMVRRVVETAVGGGQVVVRPWLGAKTDTVTSDLARSLGLSRPEGVLVSSLYPGSPAARAGLREGDVITAVDGAVVDNAAGLNYRVATNRPGETVELRILRDGKAQTVRARLEPPPASPAREERLLQGAHPLTGATVVNLSPAVADELGADPFAGRGVIITKPGRNYAAAAGFRSGDIVREINGVEIGSTTELQRVLQAGARIWRVTIERDGRLVSGTFRG
ncbi:MAG TPA: Do family serine endopeptidase [Caulobacteraceae bacterium]|nr:Do family serine endopeptidase [Caulobacteraceae bacterium]